MVAAEMAKSPLDYVNDQKNFEDLLKTHPAVLVNFTASWCGPCKMIAPSVEGLARQYPSVLIVKVDIDVNDETTTK